jgi:hypothetical protein
MSDVRDLVGDLDPEELARLERVHALLELADPPPALPPGLEHAPTPRADVIAFPRRYRYLAAAGAAAAAVVLFAFGYIAGSQGPDAVRTVTMSGPGGASATLEIYERDAAGNWPMVLDVAGLSDGRYGLWLTRAGRLAKPCGTFAIAGGETTVPLNAPYRLGDFDGWVVVAAGSREQALTT